MITYKELVKQFPDDVHCAFCGAENDWDEDGFFYLWVNPDPDFEEGQAACKKCRDGEPGKTHEKLHGKGDEGR